MHLINQISNFVRDLEEIPSGLPGIENNQIQKPMNILKKLGTYLVLPLIIIGLAYLVVDSVMEPMRFAKAQEDREAVGIQRLKDIRDLQVAFKTEYGHFSPTIDSLKMFYNTGKIRVVMQIGSQDDSVAVANTQALKRRRPRIKPEEMLALYEKGEKLVFQIENDLPVKDTLFHSRADFNIDSLAFIPFSGDSVILRSTVKKVSGVQVPLFEACMPYRSLLKGLDNQLRINLDADMRDRGRYEGLQVGSITAPNNNAGNWE